MNKRDKILLGKIIDETTLIINMIENKDKSAFLTDEVLSRAVCMTLLNIGELIKNLTSEFRQSHQSIPWKEMAGFREIAAHRYFTLRMDDVWEYAVTELPTILELIKKIPAK